MATQPGSNEGFRVLDDFVCEAIPGPDMLGVGSLGRGVNLGMQLVSEMVVDGSPSPVAAAEATRSGEMVRFAEKMAKLSEAHRLYFYEVFAHNLTVGVRDIWSDAATSDSEKVERMKWVNELLHRVTAKVYVLRLKTPEWTESDFGNLLQEYLQSHQNIGPVVEWAVRHSYQAVTGQKMG